MESSANEVQKLIGSVLSACRRIWLAAAVFSFAINLLMLTAPLCMLLPPQWHCRELKVSPIEKRREAHESWTLQSGFETNWIYEYAPWANIASLRRAVGSAWHPREELHEKTSTTFSGIGDDLPAVLILLARCAI